MEWTKEEIQKAFSEVGITLDPNWNGISNPVPVLMPSIYSPWTSSRASINLDAFMAWWPSRPTAIIKEWGEDKLFVKKLRDSGLNDEQIAIVLKTINDVCTVCWDCEESCQCWNDD